MTKILKFNNDYSYDKWISKKKEKPILELITNQDIIIIDKEIFLAHKPLC